MLFHSPYAIYVDWHHVAALLASIFNEESLSAIETRLSHWVCLTVSKVVDLVGDMLVKHAYNPIIPRPRSNSRVFKHSRVDESLNLGAQKDLVPLIG